MSDFNFDTEEYYGGTYPSAPEPDDDCSNQDCDDDYWDEDFYMEREVLGLHK